MSQIGNNSNDTNAVKKLSINSTQVQAPTIHPTQKSEGTRMNRGGIVSYEGIGAMIAAGGAYFLNNGINHCAETIYPTESLTDTSLVSTTHCLANNILGVGLMSAGIAIMGYAYWTRTEPPKSIEPEESNRKRTPVIRPAEPRRASFNETPDVFKDFESDSASQTTLKKKPRYDRRSHPISRTGATYTRDVITSTQSKRTRILRDPRYKKMRQKHTLMHSIIKKKWEKQVTSPQTEDVSLLEKMASAHEKLHHAEVTLASHFPTQGYWHNFIKKHMSTLSSDKEAFYLPPDTNLHVQHRLRFCMEVFALEKIISSDSKFKSFELELLELSGCAKSIKEQLNALSGDLKEAYKVTSNQYSSELGYGLYFPSQKHLDRNEDAYKHTQLVTVVADGLSGTCFSEAASRYVVKHLHRELEAIVVRQSRIGLIKEEIQTSIIQACKDVEHNMRQELKRLSASTTCVAELRICDVEGGLHRFLLFVGDANVVYKKHGADAILLNPWTNDCFNPELESYEKTESGVAILTLRDVLNLKSKEDDSLRDVRDCKGCFTASYMSSIGKNNICLVYLSAREKGETILVTDGVTDRIKSKGIDDYTPYKLFLLESAIRRFSSDVSLRLYLLENMRHRYRDSKYVAPMEYLALSQLKKNWREILATTRNHADFSWHIRVHVDHFLEEMNWPSTPIVIYELTEHLYAIGNGLVYPWNRPELTELIMMEQFRVTEFGFQSLRKYSDDLTFVPTQAKSSQTPDLDTRETLPFLTNYLTRHGGDIDESEFLKIIQKIHTEYQRAVHIGQKKKRPATRGYAEQHIQCQLYQAQQRYPKLIDFIENINKEDPLHDFLFKDIPDCRPLSLN